MSSNKASAGKRTDKQGSSTPTLADIEKAFSLFKDAEECLKIGKKIEATEKLTQAITLNPHPVFYSSRSSVYCSLGQYDDGINDCRIAIQLDSKCADAYFYTGWIFACQKRYKDAIEAYKKAVEIDPGNEEYKSDLASAEEKLKSVTHELSPPSTEIIVKADALKEEGNEFMKTSKFKEAIEKYTEAIALKRDAVYFCNRAAAHCGLKQYERAQIDCFEAISRDNKYVKAYGRMGFIAACMGLYFYAIRFYKKALQMDPNNESYKENLALAEAKLRETNQRP